MNNTELDRPIVLVGMMGAGKSYLGLKLAQAYDVDFIDTDKVIEEVNSNSISDIFANHGEQYFRDLEYKAILGSLERKGSVIAVGGGAYTFQRNRDIIDKIGISVWLEANPETLLSRTMTDSSRPLLKGDDSDKKIHDLLAKRESDYLKAMLRFRTDADILPEDLIIHMKARISQHISTLE